MTERKGPDSKPVSKPISKPISKLSVDRADAAGQKADPEAGSGAPDVVAPPNFAETKSSGRVAFDARGNPIWEWEMQTGVYGRDINTARLKKLEANLSILEPPAQKTPSGTTGTASAPGASAAAAKDKLKAEKTAKPPPQSSLQSKSSHSAPPGSPTSHATRGSTSRAAPPTVAASAGAGMGRNPYDSSTPFRPSASSSTARPKVAEPHASRAKPAGRKPTVEVPTSSSWFGNLLGKLFGDRK